MQQKNGTGKQPAPHKFRPVTLPRSIIRSKLSAIIPNNQFQNIQHGNFLLSFIMLGSVYHSNMVLSTIFFQKGLTYLPGRKWKRKNILRLP